MSKNGEMPEWPKGAVCKTAGDAYGGSNPPLPTTKGGCSSMVEHEPSKLGTWVRFPSSAPPWNDGNLTLDCGESNKRLTHMVNRV